MSERVRIDITDHVAEVTLNRPDKYNALDPAMFDAITEAGRSLAEDRSVRAVVLRGEGKHFCAGIDLAALSGGDGAVDPGAMAPVEGSPANRFQMPAWVWKTLPVPVVAALHGVVYGGGLQIALGADIRYAAPDAQLSVMEIKWGLIPDMGLTQTLRDVMPLDKVKELTFTGKVVSGEEAAALGLVTRVTENPLEAARALAREIAAKSPDAIRAGKRLLEESWRDDAAGGLRREAELQSGLIYSPNQLEAVSANLQKREPEFREAG